MFDIIDTITGQYEECGFDTYAAAVEYFEFNKFSYETHAIEGPADDEGDRDDEDDELGAFDDPSLMY